MQASFERANAPGRKAWGMGLFAVCVALFAVFLARSQRTAPIPTLFSKDATLESALAASAGDGKPVLAFFTADWCGPCQTFKRGALSDAGVERLARERTHPVYVDCTRANSGDPGVIAVAQRYGIRAFPTLVLLRGEEQVARIEGAMAATELTAWLERGTQTR